MPVKFEFDIVSMLRAGLDANVRFELERFEIGMRNPKVRRRKKCDGEIIHDTREVLLNLYTDV